MKKLSSCKNLGPTIRKNLSLIGVDTYAELQKRGSVKIYTQLKEQFPDRIWPMCYYLYSIEGALTDTHWDDLSEKTKEHLKRQVRPQKDIQ